MAYNECMENINYRTIQKEVVTEQLINKSKFITYLSPVETEEQAKDYLLSIKKEHHKAAHHCSAYICAEIERSNDDGEPASSAGMPMLQVLRGNKMNFVIAVVVRYFGGVELGVGGLIRAYGSSVTQAIDSAVILKPSVVYDYELIFPYEYINDVEVYLDAFATVENREYTDRVNYTIFTTDKEKLQFLVDITRGEIEFIEAGSRVEYLKEDDYGDSQ